ncbi:MAG: hypothetical protein KJP07_06505 [Desulfatitalea sp.]|nr:hypothetical protein [Desulfatitalea sp.]
MHQKSDTITAILFVFVFCISLTQMLPHVSGADVLPKANELIEKSIEAGGGLSAYEKISNKKAVCSIRQKGKLIKITVFQEKPNKHYSISDIDGKFKVEQGSDGHLVWENSPFTGARILQGEDRANKRLDYSFNILASWRKHFKKVQNAGLEEINGKPCYKVIMTPHEGTDRIYYFDKDRALPVKIIKDTMTPMGRRKIEVFPDDYRKISGILCPHTIKQVVADHESTVHIETIEFNIDMPKDRFVPPEGITKRLNENKK